MESAARPRLIGTSRPIDDVIAAVNSVILGKAHAVKLAMTCLLARGHLLIEDLPGMGKTTLAHSLARLMGLEFQRVQFVSDLLPADIVGTSVYDRQTESFRFHPGPIFTQVLLADEINRASPKAQSALLEAMEEHQVSIDGVSRPLPEPFFIIATQNPFHQTGTFPLPESQLDRFLMRIELGYPDARAERDLLAGGDRRTLLASLEPKMGAKDFPGLRQAVERVHVAPALLDYVQALIAYTRTSGRFLHGLSPRAGHGMVTAARAWAFLEQRSEVLPEHVQAILPSIVEHRLVRPDVLEPRAGSGRGIGAQIVEAVAIP